MVVSSSFLLSIETAAMQSFTDGFHLGTDEKIARALVAERFHGRIKAGMPTVSCALVKGTGRSRKVVDVYDGEWHSDRMASYE